jgi:hypothetical protein
MKLVQKTGLLLLSGCALVNQAQAGGFFHKNPTPYATVPSPVIVTQPAQPAEALTPVAAPTGAAPASLPADVSTQGAPNSGVEIQTISDRVVGQYEQATAGAVISAETGLCRVNSKRLNFHYDLKDVGPSGVMNIEVWLTQDGKFWQKYPNDIQRTGGAVDVEREGVYGISFVPRTGFGGGKEPPANGEAPQLWVEVDVTKPVVALTGMQPSAGSKTLRIDWTATDKNLGPRPVVLYYAEQSTGPWTPITTPMENTGSYVWQIAPSTPNAFYLRVAATDMAGNVGTSESQTPVRIDLSQPNVTNVRVGPGDKPE